MAEVLVNNDTKWKCVLCGKCCRELGLDFPKINLDNKPGFCSKLNSKNFCSNYFNRPVVCMMYPFHPSREDFVLGIVDFSIGKLLIDSACPGYGHGSKIVENKVLLAELDKVALLLRSRIDLVKEGKIVDAFFGENEKS